MKKLLILFLVITFVSAQFSPLFAYSQVAAYLCEIGLKFYQNGRYEEALHEFSKALIAKPDYPLALEYIKKLKQELQLEPLEELPSHLEMAVPSPREIPQARVTPAPAIPVPSIIEPKPFPEKIPQIAITPPMPQKVLPPEVLELNEAIKSISRAIELEHGKSIIVSGKIIERFLITEPNVLAVEKINPDELLVTGKDLGYTYLYVWDEQDRWALEFLVTPPKPEGPSYEEQLRSSEEKAGTFKLRYNLDWSTYETGRRVNKLNRASYYWNHGLTLNGETPYGNIDSSAYVRTLKQNTDLTYFTLGLSEAKLGPFEGFKLRTFDYTPGFSNLAFGGASLRGANLESPAFNKKVNYNLFWGREGGGRYGGLSPSLTKIKNSFLSGANVNWEASKNQDYDFSVLHGWGRDRESYLNHYSYDLGGDWNLDKVKLGYEVGYDSASFAHLLDLNYTVPKFSLTTQLRDVSKKYMSISGWGGQLGEIGGMVNMSYMPTDKLALSQRIDISKDRLYPAPDNDDRLNEYLNYDINYRIDPLTSLRLDYSLDNALGRVSGYRSHNQGLGLYRTFEFIRKVNTFINYRRQENKYFTSPASNSINDKVSLGIRFSVISELYYYLNKEFNWLEARSYGEHTKPEVMETGLDWSGQIFKSPFYGNLRCMYRDEENAVSTLGFLSGEDYLDGYSELSYRPGPDTELYCSMRVRNVWAESSTATKRVEADFRTGMRYVWDTGLRWESIGAIEGYAFKDLNGDGLRQRDEPPLEGIKIWLGKDKSLATDILGYYKFTKVKAKKAFVNIDSATITPGFVLTVPQTQEVTVSHGDTVRVNFGLISRSEITGIVFEDTDQNGQFGPSDFGIKDAVLILEDGSKVSTDSSGRYRFSKAVIGKHTLNLDLNSLPPDYLPGVPIFKDLQLFEGASFVYNIPLKKIKK